MADEKVKKHSKKHAKGSPAPAAEKAPKKVKKPVGDKTKGKKKRSNISTSATKRLLREGAGVRFTVKRVSADAIKKAKSHANSFLKTVATHLNRYAAISEKKTLDVRALRDILTNDLQQLGIKPASITAGRPLTRGLSRAGVARQLKKSQLTTARLSSEFRDALLNLTEAYLHLLGSRGADFALVSDRKTLLGRHIDAASRALLE